MKYVAVIIVAICLLSSGCTEDPFESEVISPFSLKHGQQVLLSKTAMTIEFEGEVFDNRCPLDVQCIWPGMGVIWLEVSLGSDTVRFQLATEVIGSPSPPVFVDTLGYRFELIKLDPYPELVSEPIEDSDYVATLSVTETDSGIPVGQLLITDFGWELVEDKAYAFDSLRIEGEIMTLWIKYGGGCAEHYFQLYMTPVAFAESEPVQASLYLRHFGPDDFCRAYLHDEIRFDLSPMSEMYRQQYGHGGEVIIHFRNCTTIALDCIDWSESFIVANPID